MAFDRPLEADSVDDLGLFSSFLRAPVIGTICWLLGGEDAKKQADKEEKKRLEKEIMEDGDMKGGRDEGGDEGREHSRSDADDTSGSCHEPCRYSDRFLRDNRSKASSSANPIKGANLDGAIGKENAENQASSDPSSDSDNSQLDPNEFLNNESFVTADLTTPKSRCSSGVDNKVVDIVDDLIAVMDASSLLDAESNCKSKSKRSKESSSETGPATIAVSSQCIDSSSNQYLPESYSATSFANEIPEKKITRHSSLNNFSTSIRSKKTSWSDECGHQPLVEYFDESSKLQQHQVRCPGRRRSNSWKPSRTCSFDLDDKTSSPSPATTAAATTSRSRRNEVRVIKSALRRSGSYSPPVALYGGYSRSTASSPSTTSSSSSLNSPGLKSFRSLSVIGSQSSGSIQSACSDNSQSVERQCVPSTLQVGCGRASGGLIIPCGGPTGLGGYPQFRVVLGTGASSANSEETKTSTSNAEAPAASRSPSTGQHVSNANNRAHSNPQHFLPHHSNGYVSPQYGFYVNITPPTPEMFYPRPPTHGNKPIGDKSSQPAAVQQSYQQFHQQQQPPFRPSPIPEGAMHVSSPPGMDAPQQPVFQDDQKKNNRPLKPTFPKKKGMGMMLAGNPHQVWPTVPFG